MKLKINYHVAYIGLAEGYHIVKTEEKPNSYDIFSTFKKAKLDAVKKAKIDVDLVRWAYRETKALLEKDVL